MAKAKQSKAKYPLSLSGMVNRLSTFIHPNLSPVTPIHSHAFTPGIADSGDSRANNQILPSQQHELIHLFYFFSKKIVLYAFGLDWLAAILLDRDSQSDQVPTGSLLLRPL